MGQSYPPSRFRPLPADPASMAEQVLRFSPATDAEALKLLRARFPESPLSVRVAALHVLMQRQARPARIA